MDPFISLLFFFLLIQASSTSAQPDIVVDTCEKCAESSPNVNYTLCIDSFNSIPESHNSTLQDLSIIATNITKANATGIISELETILRDTPSTTDSAYMRSCLETCLELYSDSVSSLDDSVEAIRVKRYDDANIMLSSVVDASRTCEDGFSDGEIESPLKVEDDEFFGHSVIALGIVAMLQKT